MSKISDQRRREILDAARGEFAARGVEAVSMAEIAARAGIGKSTIYEYFPSKADLFAAGCQDLLEELHTRIGQAFFREGAFREKLIAYCRHTQAFLSGSDLRSILPTLLEQSSSGQVCAAVGQFWEKVLRQMEQAVRQGQACGELDARLPCRETALYLLHLPNPNLIHSLEQLGTARPVELVADLALSGLRPGACAKAP